MIVVALTLTTLYYLVNNLFSNPCSAVIEKELISGDGKHRAVLYIINCGATTRDIWHVSILKEGEKWSHGPGNVFIADTYSADITWINPSTLKIIYSSDNKGVYKQETVIDSINVKYITR